MKYLLWFGIGGGIGALLAAAQIYESVFYFMAFLGASSFLMGCYHVYRMFTPDEPKKEKALK